MASNEYFIRIFAIFRSFSGNEQADFRNSVVTLDPLYNVVWSYDNSSGILQSHNPVNILSNFLAKLFEGILLLMRLAETECEML